MVKKVRYLGVKTLVLTFTASGEEGGGYTVGSVSMTVTYPPKITYWRRLYNIWVSLFVYKNFTVRCVASWVEVVSVLKKWGVVDTKFADTYGLIQSL